MSHYKSWHSPVSLSPAGQKLGLASAAKSGY
jgi:hypothetical protein